MKPHLSLTFFYIRGKPLPILTEFDLDNALVVTIFLALARFLLSDSRTMRADAQMK